MYNYFINELSGIYPFETSIPFSLKPYKPIQTFRIVNMLSMFEQYYTD